MNRIMFNMISLVLLVPGLILVQAIVTSESRAVAKPGKKFAVVDMQAVILNVEEGKAARSKLEKEIKAKEKELLGKKKELDKMNKEWKDQAPLLSEAARIKKQQDFQQKFLALRQQEMAFQQEIKRKEQKVTQKIAINITKLVNNIAKKRGFDMVFETSSAGLVYLKDPVDITKDVIKAYKGGGKTATAKPTAKK